MNSSQYLPVEIIAGTTNGMRREADDDNARKSNRKCNGTANKALEHLAFTNRCYENDVHSDELVTTISNTGTIVTRTHNDGCGGNSHGNFKHEAEIPDDERQGSGHCHDDSLADDAHAHHTRSAKIKLTTGFVLCFVFMIIELVGGYMSQSMAIFTDAAHLTSDLLSFGISLGAILLAQKRPTQTQTFGHYRVEVIGVLVSVFTIWALTAVLVYAACQRLIYQEFEINSTPMLIVSIIGLCLNLVMMFVLSDGVAHCIELAINFLFCLRRRQTTTTNSTFEKLPTQVDVEHSSDRNASGSHSHHHGHSHEHSHGHSHASHGHSHMNMNVRAAILHIIGDILQSIGVLVAAIIVHYWPHLKLVDPICTLIFAGLVFATTRNILTDTLHILMEGFPREHNYVYVKQALETEIRGVRHVHSLHAWSLTHGRNALIVHLGVDVRDNASFDRIRRDAEQLIRKKFHIAQTTIQVEYFEPLVAQECKSCIGP